MSPTDSKSTGNPGPEDRPRPMPHGPVEGRVVERAQISKDIKLPDVEPRQRRMPSHQFTRQPTKTKNPRKVRGGVKVASTERASASWAGQRWLRIVELAADGAAQAEGLEYAKLGQVRRVEIGHGRVAGLVQGRLPKAYRTNLDLPVFSREQWDRIIEAMIDQALYSAKLLAGEVPPSIEDVFAPLGLRLFPPEPTEVDGTITSEVLPTCTCEEPRTEARPWCKHACCLGYAVADLLAEDPWIVFRLRGMEKEELLERLRHHRSLTSAVGGAVPVYVPRLPAVEDVPVPELKECTDSFWEAPPAAERAAGDLDLSADQPDLSHPLLRRLGSSPFEQASFPIVGLFATCYDLVTRDAVESDSPAESQPMTDDASADASSPQSSSGASPSDAAAAPAQTPAESAAERRRRAMAPKKIGKAKAQKKT
ncbi:MAG: hypothetical protein AAF108_05160 [Planctomycetota bacterium]